MNRLIFLLLSLTGLAFAQSASTSPALSPDVVGWLVATVAAFGAHWLTALTKGKLGTEGRVNALIAGLFSALIAGVGAFQAGLYGHGWHAAAMAVGASLLTWVFSTGLFKAHQTSSVPVTVTIHAPPTPAPVAVIIPAPLPAVIVPVPVTAPVLTPPPAPLSEDHIMNMKFIAMLTGSLLGSMPQAPTDQQTTALLDWASTQLPILTTDAQAAAAGFSWAHLTKLVEDSLTSANALKGIYKGLDRAQVTAVVVRFVATEVVPAPFGAWLVPLLSDSVLLPIIQAAYLRVFGAPSLVPVINAPELPSGELVLQ